MKENVRHLFEIAGTQIHQAAQATGLPQKQVAAYLLEGTGLPPHQERAVVRTMGEQFVHELRSMRDISGAPALHR
ncbi:MAG: hypothetical protein WBK55_02705 [Alphaproteobacteria bacterium]